MIGTVINERYRIDSELGGGGLGIVYRSYDTLLQREVAIKVLHREALGADGHSRLMREAQIVSRLNHPHIVTFYDAGELGSSPFIVMELVSGPTLREQPTTNRETSLALISQISAALEHAHQSGVIHRDLKPENVLLENGEAAKLVDFGLAQTVDMKSVESGMFAGTLSYVSPEQILGSKLDGRTDLYSLGVMFYELITGELPFQSDEVLPMLQKHLAETPIAPLEKVPELSAELNDLIISLLSKEPNDRPDSAWDVYRAIETMIESEDNYLISLHADQMPKEQKHNLPKPPTSFIGRARELKELSDFLANPDTRLLTILGAGGMGKTRLSIEIGRAKLARYEDGVYFIPLAPLKNSAQILFEIAEGVGLQFTQYGEPRQQLLEFFKNKQILLIMDNFEHLLDGVEIITDILIVTEKVKVLATSRQKLGLSLEQIYRLGGLSEPGERGDDSTRLFAERARQILPSFVIDEDNFPAVRQVVRYVGGMPLGIELAASWVEMMTIEEIKAEMRESLDFLESELQDLPARHRNMRAVIDQTWNILTVEERNAFKRFGVFRGRFPRSAVKDVTGIDAKLLRSLLNKSVIQRDQDGYYQVHELMRQYAEEKLVENPEENEHTRDLHADFFCGLVAQYGEKILAGENYLIAPMNENIREALTWSIARKKVTNIRISLKGLLFYYIHRGIIDDGVNLARKIIDELESFARPGGESGLVYAQSLVFLAVLYSRGYSYGIEETGYAINKGIKFLKASDNFPKEQALFYALIPWQNTSLPIEERRQYFELSINTYRELDDEWGIAWANDFWAWAQNNAGDALSAEPHHAEALKIFQKLKDGRGTAANLSGIGYAHWTRHDYRKAQKLIKEATNIIEGLDLYNEKLTYYVSVIDVTMVMGDFKSAFEVAHKGYKLVQEKGGRVWRLHFFIRMIKCLIEQKEFEQVQAQREELLSVHLPDHLDNPGISGIILKTQGYIDLELNSPKKARLNFDKALYKYKQADAINALLFDSLSVIKYEIILWIARWLKRSGQYSLAAEIAYFVSMYEDYPRFFYTIIRDYKKLLQELSANLSPDEISAAKEQAEKRELESTLEEMLEIIGDNGV